MKSLNILQYLLQDASLALGASTTRDWITIQSRVKTEGLSFLTITLPTFTQWLEQSLENGRVMPEIYKTFSRKRSKSRKSVLPRFLHGLTALVFDNESGEVLHANEGQYSFERKGAGTLPHVNAVFFIRQICNLLKKVKLECTRKRTIDAYLQFEKTDSSLVGSDRTMVVDQWDTSIFAIVSSRLFAKYDVSTVLPKHGPGATADSIRGNSKYRVREYYSRWTGVFSWEDLYGFSTVVQEFDYDVFDQLKPVKVIAVPKTLKSPRMIAVEPTAMQYAQQLVAAAIRRSTSKSKYRDNVNFDNQEVNKSFALKSSKTRDFCTLDLSEASDRVSCKLVQSVFRKVGKRVLEQLFAVRTPFARLDGLGRNSVLNLRKYASMGSATTFPVESLVFLAIVLSAVAKVYFEKPRKARRSLLQALNWADRKVLVFGDDLIVPRDSYSAVISKLESYGLVVNRKKSFSNGYFRESCGMDAYRGFDITPVYVRQLLPDDCGRKPESIVSTVSLCNQLFLKGMWVTAAYVRRCLEIRLPFVKNNSPLLGLWTFDQRYEVHRYDPVLHRWLTKGFVIKSSSIEDELNGVDALLKHQLSAGVQEDPEHYKKNAVRHSLKLRQSCASPY